MSKKSEDILLSVKENRALCLMAAGHDLKDIALEIGINRQVLYRWKNQPNFQKMLNKAVADAYDSAVAELAANAKFASSELIKIIQNVDTPTRVRVSAIELVFKYADKAKAHYHANDKDNENEIIVHVDFNDDTPMELPD
jgi:transposase-like protein